MPHRLVGLALQGHVVDGAAAGVHHTVQQKAIDGVADAEGEDASRAGINRSNLPAAPCQASKAHGTTRTCG
jgi:hypothetical protein